MADLLTMRTRLRKRSGNPTTTDVPDSDLNEAINSAYVEIATRYKFHNIRKIATIPTVIGQEAYTLPTDTFAVLYVRDDTNKKNLIKAGERAYFGRTSTTNAKPQLYLRRGSQIIIMPPPDAIYSLLVLFKSRPADLALDADVPAIPDAWHEGIIQLARYYYFDTVGDMQKATVALQLFNRWAATMPLEFHDEAESIDKSVEIPTLQSTESQRLDFDHSE